uniref:Uncharacterized protein n=1 Tax=Gossypium raimondii TaxID=29730 RepID=A0A0D2NGF9_GOSRA|nr:hypothetical protein B456_005G213300 [Gossypium raimondii]
MAGLVPPGTSSDASKPAHSKADEKTDYMNLPCPIPYEELHREALMSLKPETFEGLRFDFTKGLNQKFSLSHSVFMGPTEIPSQSAETIKIPTAHYEFGGEVFWAGQHRKSGIGYAARYETDKMVATGQVANTGIVALSYVQKVSDKVSLATDLMYNYMSRDVTASVGYDYILRQCRLRGKIDSNGCTTSYLEERLNMGLNFILSAEIDHRKKDYKFGFGLTVG